MESLMSIIRAFGYAFTGVWYILRHERNARIHLLIAVGVLLSGWILNISNAELAAIFFAIILVFLAEILNTAIEKTLDVINPDHSEKVALIKDMAAGAVLVASIGAAIIGVAIFWPYLVGLAYNR